MLLPFVGTVVRAMVIFQPMAELSLLRQSLERCLEQIGLHVPLFELDPAAKEEGDVEILNLGDLFCAWVQDGRYWVDRVQKMEDSSIGYSHWEPASWIRHSKKLPAPAVPYDDDMEACRAVLRALTTVLLENATDAIFCEWRDEHEVVAAGSTVIVVNTSGKGGPKEFTAQLAETLRLPKAGGSMTECIKVTVGDTPEIVELPFVRLA